MSSKYGRDDFTINLQLCKSTFCDELDPSTSFFGYTIPSDFIYPAGSYMEIKPHDSFGHVNVYLMEFFIKHASRVMVGTERSETVQYFTYEKNVSFLYCSFRFYLFNEMFVFIVRTNHYVHVIQVYGSNVM